LNIKILLIPIHPVQAGFLIILADKEFVKLSSCISATKTLAMKG